MSDLPRAAVDAAIAALDPNVVPPEECDCRNCRRRTAEAVDALAAAVRDENGEPCPNLNCDDGVDLSTIDGLCGFCEGVGKVWVLKAGPAGHTDS